MKFSEDTNENVTSMSFKKYQPGVYIHIWMGVIPIYIWDLAIQEEYLIRKSYIDN